MANIESKIMRLTVDADNPYADPIRQFLLTEFPAKFECDEHELLDILTTAIVATGQVRYGPKPPPEVLVRMREVIAQSIKLNEPIHIVSPWGSEKPNGTGVDVAELMAIKTFSCLRERVLKNYAPGIEVRLRVENASAPHLFFERMDEARREARLYTDGLMNLVKILETDWLVVAADSLFVSEDTMNAAADELLPWFERHLAQPTSQLVLDKLAAYGWHGGAVPPETVQFYLAGYEKLYPASDRSQKIHRLARYFASALARKNLGLTGAKKEWGNNYLEVYFGTTPGKNRLPGHQKRIHYRTIPSYITSMHTPPWRAKGYLHVGDDGVMAKLTTFKEAGAMNENCIVVENNGLIQHVQADYVVE
jgi:hypothetical protein